MKLYLSLRPVSEFRNLPESEYRRKFLFYARKALTHRIFWLGFIINCFFALVSTILGRAISPLFPNTGEKLASQIVLWISIWPIGMFINYIGLCTAAAQIARDENEASAGRQDPIGAHNAVAATKTDTPAGEIE
ncbi:MAG: hypothetical protein ACOYYS_24830 [Chloroflexota bacterium]